MQARRATRRGTGKCSCTKHSAYRGACSCGEASLCPRSSLAGNVGREASRQSVPQMPIPDSVEDQLMPPPASVTQMPIPELDQGQARASTRRAANAHSGVGQGQGDEAYGCHRRSAVFAAAPLHGRHDAQQRRPLRLPARHEMERPLVPRQSGTVAADPSWRRNAAAGRQRRPVDEPGESAGWALSAWFVSAEWALRLPARQGVHPWLLPGRRAKAPRVSPRHAPAPALRGLHPGIDDAGTETDAHAPADGGA